MYLVTQLALFADRLNPVHPDNLAKPHIRAHIMSAMVALTFGDSDDGRLHCGLVTTSGALFTCYGHLDDDCVTLDKH